MGLFFDAAKYIKRVESPRVSGALDRRGQISEYIVRYFEMYSHDYIQKVMLSARVYAKDVMSEAEFSEAKTPEMQAITIIIQVLHDFVSKGALDELNYQRPLAAQEAFKMYSGMISKSIDLGMVDRKAGEKRIAAFYRQCDIS